MLLESSRYQLEVLQDIIQGIGRTLQKSNYLAPNISNAAVEKSHSKGSVFLLSQRLNSHQIKFLLLKKIIFISYEMAYNHFRMLYISFPSLKYTPTNYQDLWSSHTWLLEFPWKSYWLSASSPLLRFPLCLGTSFHPILIYQSSSHFPKSSSDFTSSFKPFIGCFSLTPPKH